MMPNADKPIIFYDSYCGLCHFFVKWVMKLDDRKLISFAPINGENFQKLIPKNYQIIDSVLFLEAGNILIKSKAVLRILTLLNKTLLLRWLIIITPQFISDFIYDRIAKNRRKNVCEFVISDDRFLK